MNLEAFDFKKVLFYLPSGVILLDQSGKVVYSNLYIRKLIDVDIDGKYWTKCIEDIFSPQKDDGHEISLKNGRIVKLQTQSLYQNKGQVIVVHDLTDSRTLQAWSAKQEKMRVMADMAGGLGHQLRTPLSSALLNLSLIKEDCCWDEKKIEIISKLYKNLNNMKKQIDQNLVWIKEGDLQVEETSIQEILKLIESSCLERLSQLGRKIIINCKNDHVKFLCNKTAIVGAIENLINNAHDESQIDLPIMVNVSNFFDSNEEMICFSVSDFGEGVSEEVAQNVFEPFFTTKEKGNGIGLYYVKKVAVAHQGDVYFKSSPGVGTTVSILIPTLKMDLLLEKNEDDKDRTSHFAH